MKMSDVIAQRIIQLLEQSDEGMAEIQRNLLADSVGCVPSQINYVIASRFTPEQGYLVESKRGGGGYIRITRVHAEGATAIMHLINSIGAQLDAASARVLIENLMHRGMIDLHAARLMDAATSDNSYRCVPPAQRDSLRAAVFKQMLMTLV